MNEKGIFEKRWRQAQREELLNWQRTAATTRNVLAAMAPVAALDGFITSFKELRPVTQRDSRRVLEIGIGPLGLGWVALFAEGDPTSLLAVDSLPLVSLDALPDNELAAFVRKKRQRYSFLRIPAEDAQFERSSLDLVVCDNVLDHARNPSAIMRKTAQWLRPKGYFVVGISAFSALGLIKWHVLGRMHPEKSNFVMHPHSGTHGMWQRAIQRAGFRIIAEDHARLFGRVVGRARRSYFLATNVS